MKAREFARKMIEMITTPEMRVLPGQLAFFIVMSLIPLVALCRMILAHIGVPLSEIFLGTAIPKEVATVINNIDSHAQSANISLVTFLILGFILASNGAHSMIITSNEIYKVDSSDWLSRRIKAILMTFIFVGLFLFILIVPVFGDSIFNIIKSNIDNQQGIDILYRVYQIIKYPIILIIVYLNIKMIYVMAPDIKIKSKATTKGAIFTTIGWLIASEVYSLYTTYFVRYDVFYGSISSILVLLIWVYLMAYIFSLGLIINATGTFEESKEIENKE